MIHTHSHISRELLLHRVAYCSVKEMKDTKEPSCPNLHSQVELCFSPPSSRQGMINLSPCPPARGDSQVRSGLSVDVLNYFHFTSFNAVSTYVAVGTTRTVSFNP